MERPLGQSVADPTYLEFFGLTQSPFGRISDPNLLFQTEQYSLLTEHLVNATTHSDFLLGIRGADGSGKSTLINTYLSSVGNHIYSVLIDENCDGELQFYNSFLKQIGFDDITGTASELKNITKEFLVCRGIAGDHVLVIIDNAHLTGPMILEQLRWISGIKAKDRRVISAVLAGNADLIHVIEAPSISRLKFGSHVIFNLRNYSREETASYVWHRLRLAGGGDGVKLSNEVSLLIHRYSGGIPQQINRLCNDMLEEACRLETRVINERVVRTVANRQGLLPHVVPLHGTGRRGDDPDFEHVKAAPELLETTTRGEAQKSKSVEDSALVPPGIGPQDLLKYVSQLSEQIENLRADKVRALQDIDARNHDVVELRNELDAQIGEAEKLRRSLSGNAELEQARRAHEAAENELAIAAAAVGELSQSKQELQATVDDLMADVAARIKVADERAAETKALEKNTADLKDTIDGKLGELASRDEDLASLQEQLRASQKECESAQLHIAALKTPQELEAVITASDELAAELSQEGRARKAAENELAIAAATVEELSQSKQELQATVDDLMADVEARIKVADERAAETKALEKNTADLKDTIDGKLGELASRDEDLASLQEQLRASQKECESAQLHIAALKTPQELEAVITASDELAAELSQEGRARKAAENELAIAAATVEELSQSKQQLQATVDDLMADVEARIKVADERAAETKALEKNTADLKDTIDGKLGELASLGSKLALRNEILADLEIRFDRSQSECESAHRHIAALKSPQELEAIEKASNKLAADLEQERRAREAAENELVIAAAAVEELSWSKQELQATVDDFKANLKDEIDGKIGELASRDEILASLQEQLRSSQRECESAQLHIATLKSPQELEAVKTASDELAAELSQEGRARKAAENELAIAAAAVEELSQSKQELQATVDDLMADVAARIKVADERAAEIKALEKNTADLKDTIDGKLGELASRDEDLASLQEQLRSSQRECESAQLHIATLKSPQELEAVKTASDELAAELSQEGRARKAAENELAIAAAAVEELSQSKHELQATVDDLMADVEARIKVADERAAETKALEKNTADLKDTIDGKLGELASRDEDLASLQEQLRASQKECESAQLHIAALKSPQELEAVITASDELAAELSQESRARKAAENELAIAAATVEELSQSKQQLQATVDEFKADLEAGIVVADERVDEIEALSKNTADLKAEIEGKICELASRDEILASLQEQLRASQKECESAQLQIAALKSPQELEAVETASDKLAADLEQEGRARAAAENELAIAAVAVEELSQTKQELQATVDDLKADLKVGIKVADERADEIDSLVNNTVDLKYEIEGKIGQLASRDETLASLEAQLQASQKECEMLRRNASATSIDEDTAEEEKEDVMASAVNAPVQSSHVVQKFEQSISNVRAYEALRRYDPTSYNNLITTYKTLVGQDLTDKEVNDGLRAKQAKLIERLVPKASDEAIITYARLIVDELDEFHARRTEPCLTLLIPPSNPDNDASPIYSEITKDRELDTLDIVLRTYDADKRLPTESEVWPDLGPIFADLFEVFGADNVAAMQNSYDPSVDRVLVCSASKALYSRMLKLPSHNAAKALRWLYSD